MGYYGNGFSQTSNNSLNVDVILDQKMDFLTKGLSFKVKGSYIIWGNTGGYVDKQDNFIGEAFDGSFTEANPSIDFSRTANLTINGLVTGLSEVLQRRKIGERLEVYVPWKYGYGSSDYTPKGSSITILGYSTLVFDIQMLKCEK